MILATWYFCLVKWVSARTLAAAIALGAAFVAAVSPAQAQITVSDARSAPPPPAVMVGVAYFSITNHGAKSDRLISLQTAAAADVMLHETRRVEGSLKMRAVDGIDCPAGKTMKI